MLRSAVMFSSGTRPAFSVVWARALICGAICATRLRSSAMSGRSDGDAGTSFNWATDTIGLLRVFDGLKGGQVAGAVHAARLQFMQTGCVHAAWLSCGTEKQ